MIGLSAEILFAMAKAKRTAAKKSRQWSLNTTRQQDADVLEAEAQALEEQAKKLNTPSQPSDTAVVNVNWDWKDANEAYHSIKKMLPQLGLYVYDDPACKGQDHYGLLISKEPLSKAEIKNISEE